VVICLERGADLHMAQLMPLPLTVSCSSKIQIGFTFLVLADPVVPDRGPLNVCMCMCNYKRSSFLSFADETNYTELSYASVCQIVLKIAICAQSYAHA